MRALGKEEGEEENVWVVGETQSGTGAATRREERREEKEEQEQVAKATP